MAPMLKMDELVKEYLLFRGFNSSLKQIEIESKQDKDKGYRVRLSLEQCRVGLTLYIENKHSLGDL